MEPATSRAQFVIGDFGSQYTLLAESSNRKNGFRSAVFDPLRAVKWITNNPPKGIIFSGGPKSVNDADAIRIPTPLLKANVPKLAVCYGMQEIARTYGGSVKSVETQRGYSREAIEVDTSCALFRNMPRRQVVWASHGDSVTRVPKGFRVIARNTETGGIAGMVGKDASGNDVWCLQFHPEVHHTKYGKDMLRNYAALCGAVRDWKPGNIVGHMQQAGREEIRDRLVLMGGSGGVDSTTLAKIYVPVFGKRLHIILINGGQLREGEVEEAKRNVKAAGARLRVVDARARFARAFGNVIDAEEVRAVFRKLYAEIFVEEAYYMANGDLNRVVLLQGTLAPDRIESGATGGALIKTHHNVDLDTGDLVQLHPFADLFKYEVRALARKLGLPRSVSERHPFPGPGEFIRIPGLPKTPENLAIVRWCDNEVTKILKHYGWFDRISQLVVTYEGVKLVGVKGDARVYKPFAVVRAVRTIDFMTAEGVIFSPRIVREIETVLTRHSEVSRVRFDSTNKPPATTEGE
ncbi:MAG TPA: gamma-glutamyl-gamma-aminobutyrate hydrolase family protein [Candidatus Paceibacterota bacterium]|jgi:GMP synthase (glutamine-hydrolysing)|nr:gamma-glutamyl-gamma-aminobutyrate hydrolase family protein [Candidatus Paceibacterota bacterium]